MKCRTNDNGTIIVVWKSLCTVCLDVKYVVISEGLTSKINLVDKTLTYFSNELFVLLSFEKTNG